MSCLNFHSKLPGANELTVSVPNLQMRCSDLIRTGGYLESSSSNGCYGDMLYVLYWCLDIDIYQMFFFSEYYVYYLKHGLEMISFKIFKNDQD